MQVLILPPLPCEGNDHAWMPVFDRAIKGHETAHRCRSEAWNAMSVCRPICRCLPVFPRHLRPSFTAEGHRGLRGAGAVGRPLANLGERRSRAWFARRRIRSWLGACGAPVESSTVAGRSRTGKATVATVPRVKLCRGHARFPSSAIRPPPSTANAALRRGRFPPPSVRHSTLCCERDAMFAGSVRNRWPTTS